jgi:hypothetical protein
MLKKHNIRKRDNGKLYQEHLSTGDHPSRRNNFIPERDNILNSLTIYQVHSAFDLNDSLVGANSVVAILKVKAKGDVGAMLKEDIADRTVNNVVDGQGLYNRPSS